MAFLAVAAWTLHPVAGLITVGLLLVLIGYATDDRATAMSFRRVVAPFSAARQKRRQKRAEAK